MALQVGRPDRPCCEYAVITSGSPPAWAVAGNYPEDNILWRLDTTFEHNDLDQDVVKCFKRLVFYLEHGQYPVPDCKPHVQSSQMQWQTAPLPPRRHAFQLLLQAYPSRLSPWR